jgi:DNA-directed RNA polymerase specialized sigma24 family protein
MNDQDDIRQNAILRRLKSGTPIDRSRRYEEHELYAGKEYGVAFYSARTDAHRQYLRDEKHAKDVKISPHLERYNSDERRHLRGIDCDDAAERCIHRESVTLLLNQIAILPARERDVIQRCDLCGRDIRLYAMDVGISERAAASLRHRAIRRLRKELDSDWSKTVGNIRRAA